MRRVIFLVCLVACGGHAPAPPPVAPSRLIVAGPTVTAESLRVAATDSSGVGLAHDLAPGAPVAVVSSRGALDFIDSGGGVLVTDRQSVIRYASARSDFAVIPLPWDRLYILISDRTLPGADVLDAVRADARAPTLHCPADTTRPRDIDVAYPPGDSIAKSLAERLVGLGLAVRAMPRGQAAMAFIFARPIFGADCRIVPNLAVTPLVETRSRLIVRRGAVGVIADSAGAPRLEVRP